MSEEPHWQSTSYKQIKRGSCWWNPEYRLTAKVHQFNGMAVHFRLVKGRNSSSKVVRLPVETFLGSYRLADAVKMSA